MIMKTAITGKIRFRFFWGSTWSNGRRRTISEVFHIGRLILAKVVYPTKPFRADYYKASVLKELQKHFNVVWENIPGGDDTGEMWHYVYSKIDGGEIGTPESAYALLQRGLCGIQKSKPENNVCSIGYKIGKTAEDQKWFGWSHRAMYGFGIGDVVKEGDCCASSGWTDEYLLEHPEEDTRLPVGFKAESLEDCRTMAKAFAESVS
jgi:hypothetical protein